MSNVVTTRLVQFAFGIENAAPRIVVCIDSAAQCDDHFLCTREFSHQLCANGFEFGSVYFTVCGCYVETFWFNAEYLFRILFVTKDYVTTCNQFRHHFRGRFAIFPQIFAVIKVA